MTEQSREYGEGLYALCAEEALSGDVLEELDVLNDSFKAQPDYLRLLSNMSLGREERLGILDKTLTPMGARLLRMRVSQPLLDQRAPERALGSGGVIDGVARLAQNARSPCDQTAAMTGVAPSTEKRMRSERSPVLRWPRSPRPRPAHPPRPGPSACAGPAPCPRSRPRSPSPRRVAPPAGARPPRRPPMQRTAHRQASSHRRTSCSAGPTSCPRRDRSAAPRRAGRPLGR